MIKQQLSTAFVLIFLMAGQSVNAFVCARACSLASQKLVSNLDNKNHHDCHSQNESGSRSKQNFDKNPLALSHCQRGVATSCQMNFCHQDLLPFEMNQMDPKEKLSLETAWPQREFIASLRPGRQEIGVHPYSGPPVPSRVRLHLRLQRFLI